VSRARTSTGRPPATSRRPRRCDPARPGSSSPAHELAGRSYRPCIAGHRDHGVDRPLPRLASPEYLFSSGPQRPPPRRGSDPAGDRRVAKRPRSEALSPVATAGGMLTTVARRPPRPDSYRRSWRGCCRSAPRPGEARVVPALLEGPPAAVPPPAPPAGPGLQLLGVQGDAQPASRARARVIVADGSAPAMAASSTSAPRRSHPPRAALAQIGLVLVRAGSAA